MTKPYETIIVGGGPAGLTAGMYAARSKLTAVVLERGLPGGQLLNTKDIEDSPGFHHVGGMELAQLMTQHAERFGCEIHTDTVTRISENESDDPWMRWRVE